MPPCDRAPVEIWQNIFLLLSQTEVIPEFDEMACNFWGRKPQISSTRGPVILPRTPTLISQVSLQWREYAYGAPGIWNVLFVKSPRYTSEYNGSQYTGISELVKRRLSLTRSMPLTICVDAKDDTEFARLIIPTLLPFSQLWETLHLYAPTPAFADLESLQASDTPRLVSLKTISQMYIPGEISSSKLIHIPLLDRTSTIQRFCTSILPTHTASIYDTLQELHIQQIRSETKPTLLVLASCPRLRVLTLSGFGIPMSIANSPPTPRSLLTMPALEIVNIEHPVGRESLLDLLVIPNLRSVFLCGKCDGESSQSILQCINRLKKRSNVSSLERLSISLERHSLDPSIVIEFLRVNPTLKFLWIDDTYKFMNQPLVTSYLFAALTKSPSKSNGDILICPQLESLKLTGCSEFEDSALLAFLRSRRHLQYYEEKVGSKYDPAASITEVSISVKRKVDPELIETVQQWQTMGYSINLNSRS